MKPIEQNAIVQLIRSHIKDIPDFPKNGILFRDVLPVFQNHLAAEALFNEMTVYCKKLSPDYIFALDARGFLFGPILSQRLGVPFIPIRKAGKLPGDCISEQYMKEYGGDILETYKMDLTGKSIVIVDDLVATGGSVKCAEKLIIRNNGKVKGFVFAIELCYLKAKNNLSAPVFSVVKYE
eukprot:NODE_38_length_35257_cov_0.939047.p24 type:complete len:180 gc:universal NODE_38_length_35257_cov_0.939047:3625-4164(+)